MDERIEENDPFSRRPLLERSPTTPVVSKEGMLQFFTPQEDARGKKRKLSLSPVLTGKSLRNFINAAMKMTVRAEKLMKLVKENKNTKKELKDEIHCLVGLARELDQLKREVVEETGEDETIDLTGDSEEMLDAVQEEEDENEIDVREFCSRCRKEIEVEERKIQVIKGAIMELKNGSGGTKFMEVLGKVWPEGAYTKPHFKGKLKDLPRDIVKVIVTGKGDLDKLEGARWIKDLTGQTLLTEVPLDRPVICQRTDTLQVIGEEDKMAGSQDAVFFVVSEAQTLNGVESLCNGLRKITGRFEGRKIAMTGFGLIMGPLRKIAEVVDSDLRLYTPDTYGTPASISTSETIVVRRGDGSYAEMARKIKASVIPDSSIVVKEFKETIAGDVKITMEKGGAAVLKEEILKKIQAAQVEVHTRKDRFCLFNLDPSCTKEEVAVGIAQAIFVDKKDVEVKNIRKNKIGSATAYVGVPAMGAQRLAALGYIKIGWTQCRVKPDEKLDRCFNCLQMGHVKARCKNKPEPQKCFNCTGTDHQASSCKNEMRCLACGVVGHRNDMYTCPKYREILDSYRY